MEDGALLIPDRDKMLELFFAGRLGNVPIPFQTIEEAKASGLEKVAIRERTHPGKPPNKRFTRGDVAVATLEKTIRELVAQGADRSRLYFNQFIPFEWIILVGEVAMVPREQAGIDYYSRSSEVLCLNYAWHPRRVLREVLAEEPNDIYGAEAEQLLRTTLGQSYNKLEEYLYKFSGAAIEFLWADRPVGTLGERLCFLEVRHY